MEAPNAPKFRVIKGPTLAQCKVIIQCSKCRKDIREMSKTETLAVNRGYFCKECDDGTIHLNMPLPDAPEQH